MSEHHDGVTLADVAVLDIWGKYASAIERWAEIVGRPAPPPTDDEGRLNPAFVEWMMGYGEGWCDPIATRTGKLRCLGNAIVPLQAASAWGHLLGLEVTTAERESFCRLRGPATRTERASTAAVDPISGRS